MKTVSNFVKLSRSNLELLYSILLLLLIPGLMVANTVYISSTLRRDVSRVNNHIAASTNSSLRPLVLAGVTQPETLSGQLVTVTEKDDLIDYLSVYLPTEGAYEVVASTSADDIGKIQEDTRFTAVRQAIGSERPVSGIITKGGERFISTVSPVILDDGKIAMLRADISLENAETIFSQTYFRSFVILFITVFVIALLLSNHFRFVSYAQLTKKLQEADRLKTDFLSVATHELKAPMTVIKGNIANVLDGTFGEVNADIKSSLETSLKETSRLTSLIQDLLNVSRIEQGRISINLTEFEPAPVIEAILRNYKTRAKNKGLELDYQPPQNGVKLRADRGRYIEIMTNLIDNAWKYSLQGKVTIRHELTDKTLTTRVKDTGIGLSAHERENLFQRFYRARNDKTRDIGGTGLGLWIIKQYIEKMGGQITVDSLEGVGSEFIVELPRA